MLESYVRCMNKARRLRPSSIVNVHSLYQCPTFIYLSNHGNKTKTSGQSGRQLHLAFVFSFVFPSWFCGSLRWGYKITLKTRFLQSGRCLPCGIAIGHVVSKVFWMVCCYAAASPRAPCELEGPCLLLVKSPTYDKLVVLRYNFGTFSQCKPFFCP